jgi:Leucine Rich repeat
MLCVDGAVYPSEQPAEMDAMPEVFRAVQSLPALRELRLSTPKFLAAWPADADILQAFQPMLTSLPALTSLALDVGLFTYELASALEAAIPSLRSLRALVVAADDTKLIGAHWYARTRGYKLDFAPCNHETLMRYVCDRNRALCRILLARRDLLRCSVRAVGADGTVALERPRRLWSRLNPWALVAHVPRATPALADAIAPLRALRSLALTGGFVRTADMHALAALAASASCLWAATLQQLDISGNGFGDAGARALAAMLPRLAAIECIDVGENEIGTPGAAALAAAVACLLTLRTFNAMHNPMDPAALEAACAQLPHFEHSSCSSPLKRNGAVPDFTHLPHT